MNFFVFKSEVLVSKVPTGKFQFCNFDAPCSWAGKPFDERPYLQLRST